MEYALLGMGVLVLLVVVAAGIEAYLRGNTRRPLARSRPTNVAKRAPGQLATDTNLLQDVLEARQRQKRAQN